MAQTDHWSRDQVFTPGKVPIAAHYAHHVTEVPAHDHAFVEIVAVLGGEAQHETQAGRTDLQPGDVLVLRPGVWHGYMNARELKIYNCCFGHELLNRELAWTLDDPVIGPLLWGPRHGGGTIHFNLPPATVLAAASEFGEVRSPEGWAAPVGRLLVFLGALSQGVRGETPAPAVICPEVAEVVRRIEADLPRAWSMEAFSRLAGWSAAYLTRRFHAAMGVAPMAYLTRCRAERAAALLLQTQDDIADIGMAVGWDDPVYFARRFRQHYAMPPREYRKRFGRST